MSAADPLIKSIHVTANILSLMSEAQLNDDERYLFNHIIDRFGDKRGFKVTSFANVQAAIAVEKLVVAGIITNDDCELHSYLWTEKWKEVGYAD